MIKDASPVIQALLGTLLTWGLTAAGAAVAFFIQGKQVSTFKFINACHEHLKIQIYGRPVALISVRSICNILESRGLTEHSELFLEGYGALFGARLMAANG